MSMLRRLGGAMCLLAIGCLASPSRAQIEPSAGLLVPYFAVDLADPVAGDGTLFAVSHHDGLLPADVVVTVHSNWGIPVLQTRRTMAPDEVVTVNLRDWIVEGKLLDRQLGAAEIAILQAQLSGLPTPHDRLYYGSAIRDRLAVGYVTIHAVGPHFAHSLWGDFFTIEPTAGVFQADTLVNIDPTMSSNLPCRKLGIRFLEAGLFARGTHLVVWSPKRGGASAAPLPRAAALQHVAVKVHDEAGAVVDERTLALLPDQVVELHELVPALPLPFGWLELELDTAGFVGADYNVHDAMSAGLHAFCLPADERAVGPRVSLDKSVNGYAADLPPGPLVKVGSTLVWTYEVVNRGSEPLYDLAVSDEGRAVDCPQAELAPGAAFTCTATGTAAACQQRNEAVVTGNSDKGPVQDRNLAHYFGQRVLALEIVSVTAGGRDAENPKGPTFIVGDTVDWTWRLRNGGDVALSGLSLDSPLGALPSCPRTSLGPGEEMVCTASEGPAALGDHSKQVIGRATGPCPGDAYTVSRLGYYTVSEKPPLPGTPSISIEKLANGEQADAPPGPLVTVGTTVSFTYVVINSGDVTLSGVRVVDDQGLTVSCPKAVLASAELMTCTASTVARTGHNLNLGTASGTPPVGDVVSSTDAAHYLGISPAVRLKKLVNGADADTKPGPLFVVGTSLLFTYVVTNTGDVALSQLDVVDDQGLAVSCPKTVLQPAESMTCTASATAVAGQYSNLGTVTGTPPAGSVLTASDAANYVGIRPAIGLEKLINGQDAPAPPGPTVVVGSTVPFTYVVTNIGDVQLSAVTVTDDQGLDVSCPKTALAAGESMTCTAMTKAVSGQYCNIGTASGNPPVGPAVTAAHSACYSGIAPAIHLEKLVNGQEADEAPGPTLEPGSSVLFTYVVTNRGDVRLSQVKVIDDNGLAVTCPKTALEPGEAMTCTASATAVTGPYVNIGTATGKPPAGFDVVSTDAAHYKGVS